MKIIILMDNIKLVLIESILVAVPLFSRQKRWQNPLHLSYISSSTHWCRESTIFWQCFWNGKRMKFLLFHFQLPTFLLFLWYFHLTFKERIGIYCWTELQRDKKTGMYDIVVTGCYIICYVLVNDWLIDCCDRHYYLQFETL